MRTSFIKTSIVAALLYSGLPNAASAEIYRTEKGTGSFSVSAPAKTITATTDRLELEIDDQAGRLRLKVPVNSFAFSNNYLSDSMNAVIFHRFNAHYMESERFPYVIYNAEITNAGTINLKKDGDYPIQASGTLEIHGVKKTVHTQGQIRVHAGRVSVQAAIIIKPQDYNIPIPEYIGSMYFNEVHIESNAVLQKQK